VLAMMSFAIALTVIGNILLDRAEFEMIKNRAFSKSCLQPQPLPFLDREAIP